MSGSTETVLAGSPGLETGTGLAVLGTNLFPAKSMQPPRRADNYGHCVWSGLVWVWGLGLVLHKEGPLSIWYLVVAPSSAQGSATGDQNTQLFEAISLATYTVCVYM